MSVVSVDRIDGWAELMANVGQALVWDKKQGGYVVVQVGHDIPGFRVLKISKDQVICKVMQTGVCDMY